MESRGRTGPSIDRVGHTFTEARRGRLAGLTRGLSLNGLRQALSGSQLERAERTAQLLDNGRELLFPRSCAGCGTAGAVLCLPCRTHLRQVPLPVVRPRDIGAPVWALGPYSQIRQGVIISMKEKRNTAIRPYVGAVFAAGIAYLQAQGELPARVVLVPAPTRARTARLRGGDPVTHIARNAAEVLNRAAGKELVKVHPCVAVANFVLDQSGLDAGRRWANMSKGVQYQSPISMSGQPVVIIDDVVTTGATLAATTKKLQAEGMHVEGCLTLANA